jgi:hypothetical protein
MKNITNYLFESMKDFVYFFWLLIDKNKGKVTSIILLLLTIHGLRVVDSQKINTIHVRSTITSDSTISMGLIDEKNTIAWLSMKDSDGNLKIYNKSDFSSYKIDGNKITYNSENEFFIFLVVIFIILSAIILVGTLSSDTDINWELKEVKKQFLFKKIESEEEDGNKYYYIYDRILFKHSLTQRIEHWHIINNCEESIAVYLKNKKLLNEYIPKRIKREKKLEEILK